MKKLTGAKSLDQFIDLKLLGYYDDDEHVVDENLISDESAANDNDFLDDWSTDSIKLPAHAATSIFPAMGEAEFQELKADIAKNGLRQPILVYRNQVIDGRERMRACTELGIEPQYKAVDVTEKTVAEYIVSMNLKRRHLNDSQRAMVANSLAQLGKGKRANTAQAVTQAQASQMLNVSVDSIQRARIVEKNGIPALVQAVENGKLDVTNASSLAGLDEEKQAIVLELDDKKILKMAKEIRKSAMSDRRKKRIEAIEQKRANNKPLQAEAGTYNVIYADPAWDYISEEALGYPTMSLQDIQAMPVNTIAADDAVLFLWCSASLIGDALKVIESWGFNYKTHAIWDKQKAGQGAYFRIQHELLLIATRGDVPEVPYEAREASVFDDPTGAPSEKPKRIREVIDAMYPEFRKIELFCRGTPAMGWDGWGNECANDPLFSEKEAA